MNRWIMPMMNAPRKLKDILLSLVPVLGLGTAAVTAAEALSLKPQTTEVASGMIEDDGVSLDFERGALNRVTLSWDPAHASGTVTRTGPWPGKRYQVIAWSTSPP